MAKNARTLLYSVCKVSSGHGFLAESFLTSLPCFRFLRQWTKSSLGRDSYFEKIRSGRYRLIEEARQPSSMLNSVDVRDEEEEDEVIYPEGKEVYKLHRSRERNRKVVDRVKEKRIKVDPLLNCEVCGFSFIKVYGDLGQGFIEAHHTKPISQSSGEIQTLEKDIALVCSNCHRMLHRSRKWWSITELRDSLKNRP